MDVKDAQYLTLAPCDQTIIIGWLQRITNELQNLYTSRSVVRIRPRLRVTESHHCLMIVQWLMWREFIVSGYILMSEHSSHIKSPLLMTVIGRDLENEKFNQEFCSLPAMTTLSI